MSTNTCMIKEEPCLSNNTPDIFNPEEIAMLEFITKYRFKLFIPSADEQPIKDFHVKRKSFAIACYTTVPKEDILKHIQMKFDPHLEYVCISLLKWNPSVVFIQIILQKVINKKTYFLNSVAGMQCNYRVTNADQAWNEFLKKVGDYIEYGQFKSVRSRHGINLGRRKQPKDKEKNARNSIKVIQFDTRQNQQFAMQLAKNIIGDVETSLKRAIDRTIIEMPIDCPNERQELLNRLLPTLDYFLMQYDNENTSSISY